MSTLKDIALKTGFSVTTVSRALNGYFDVNESTRKMIIQAAKDLNYSPNILARGLVTKRSKTIGFLISDLKRESAKDGFMFNTLCGLSDALSTSEYEFVLFSTTIYKKRGKTFRQLCTERQLDGVIIQGLKMDDPYLQEAATAHIPCVVIDIPMEAENICSVTSNQQESAAHAVRYLYRMNHRRIAFVNGAPHAHVSHMRKLGYETALQDLGLEVKVEYIVDGDFSEDKARQVTIPLLLNHPQITAIFCASDVMALGVLKAAGELDIEVPTQLSVIGFDNILLARYVTPPLTTIGQSPYQLGAAAAELLIQYLEEEKCPPSIVIENELVIRDSVAFYQS